MSRIGRMPITIPTGVEVAQDGHLITVKGKVQPEIFKEPEFFKALMGIWLGPNPAYWKLKENLMGDMS